jgi:hypothetical protein
MTLGCGFDLFEQILEPHFDLLENSAESRLRAYVAAAHDRSPRGAKIVDANVQLVHCALPQMVLITIGLGVCKRIPEQFSVLFET